MELAKLEPTPQTISKHNMELSKHTQTTKEIVSKTELLK